MTDPEPPPAVQSPAAEAPNAGVAGSVTGQWAEVYPPDGAMPDPAADPALRGPAESRTGAVATVLYGVAAILVVAGSLMPQFQADLPVSTAPDGFVTVLSMDAWQLTSNSVVPTATPLLSQVEPAPIPLGYPLLAAALLLVVVVILRLGALRRPVRERFAGALGIGAAAFVTGLVFAIGTFEVAWRALNTSVVMGPAREVIGTGYWLLVLAAVVSLVAVFVAYRRTSEPLPDSVGMAIVDQPAEQPGDPLVPPGQPAEWPVVAVIPTDERTNW